MPQYSTAPPKDSAGYGIPLIRTPANGKLVLAIVSEEMIGCPTHWYRGRTVPCEAVDCQACNDGYPWRWHGYVIGMQTAGRRLVLFECTAQAAEEINKYRTINSTLRGCILTTARHRNRHNGRVIVTTQAGDLAQLNLPSPPLITAHLAKIWNLPAVIDQVRPTVKGVQAIAAGPQDAEQKTHPHAQSYANYQKARDALAAGFAKPNGNNPDQTPNQTPAAAPPAAAVDQTISDS